MPKKTPPPKATLTFHTPGDEPSGEGAVEAPGGGGSIPEQLQGMHSAFKMCAPRRAALPPPSGDAQSCEGATFYAVFPSNLPRCEDDFKGNDFMFQTMYMVQPLAPGRALAPHEYARGSKKTKEQLIAHNKTGAPLTAWADSSHSSMRFWACEKKGFNRGNRVEALTWTYGGGHTMSMCLNIKDMQPREYDGCVPFFMDKKAPEDDMMLSFDLVRVSIMPKNEDGLKKDKKACFVLKSAGPTVRSLASVLPHLRSTMKRSKDEAEADSLRLLRGEEPYTSKSGLLPYAHQVDSMPPKEDRENYAMSEITTSSFLEDCLGPDTTFIYGADSKVVRMCIKPTGCQPYTMDMPRAAVLKNANAKTLHEAVGLYTLAAHCPGALCALVMHRAFWGSSLWDADCGFGDATPFRGAPIVDASRLVAPLCRDDFYLSPGLQVQGEGKKARVEVDLGFKMPVPTAAADDSGDADADCDAPTTAVPVPVRAEVAIVPRRVKGGGGGGSAYSVASDMRLSPHGSVAVEIAHVMTVFVGTGEGRHNILNLDFNGARDVGSAPVVSGKRHAWSTAIPSAIDDEDEDADGEDDSQPGGVKRLKSAMDSVA